MRNLEEDKKLCEEASSGPWKWSYGNQNRHEVGHFLDSNGLPICDFGTDEDYYPTAGSPPNYENERFITESREALPYWIAQYEAEHTARLAAEQRVRELEEVIEHLSHRWVASDLSPLEPLPLDIGKIVAGAARRLNKLKPLPPIEGTEEQAGKGERDE